MGSSVQPAIPTMPQPRRTTARRPARRTGPFVATLITMLLLGLAGGLGATPLAVPPPDASAPATLPDTPSACGGLTPIKNVDSTWQCTWSDEFDGDRLSDAWSLIPYGLGSSCLFDNPEYVRVSDGALRLTADRLPVTHWCTQEYGLEYGGGGIQSLYGFSQAYGRFEIRAKLPDGAGFWPAFWLLPADDSYDGEIDVLEAYGGRDYTIDATLHSPAGGPGPQATCPVDPDYFGDFHTYTLEWAPDRMRVLYDGKICADFTGFSDDGTVPPAFPVTFGKPYHILLNLAVQPWYPPDSATQFPGVMEVDYVRAWR